MLKSNSVAEKNKVRKEQHLALYHRLWTSPDGRAVLADLELMFPEGTLKKTKDGITDPYSSIAAAGSREPIIYIKYLIGKADAPTD